MNSTDLVTAVSLFLAVIVITPILGRYMFDVFEGRRVILSPALRPIERAVYKMARIDEKTEQGWKAYAVSVLAFSFISVLMLYVLQRVQGALPLNQAGMGPVEELLSFNTAASFVTNTNWQNYAGESTMTHLTQAAGLAVQNFVSAATGMAVAIALTRGLVRRSADTIGNFWVDLTRATVYVLLPIAFVAAIILVWQGVTQTWAGPSTITTLEGVQQTIALGPLASQESIKELGNNGGGFFNANSAHPFESPTGFTNWFEMLLILVIPFGLTATFGRYVGNRRQGWAIFAAMFLILVVGSGVAMGMEANGNALMTGTDQAALGNMEGKEVRFGAAAGGLFAAVTTGTSTGAINAAHSSLTPIGGLVPLFNMLLGEITPGGAGAGLYGMLVFAILAVFIAGLMVGRTPEYLGKKIEPFEMKMAMLVVLILATSVLGFTALGTVIEPGEAGGPGNSGPHAFSEVLYAFASQTGNNGSAFGSLTGNVPFYNLAGGFAMLIGRFGMIVPILAIAGSMAAKRRVAPSLGTFPTTGPIFVGLLIGVVIIVGALT
ncbi:MAG: potassium-transporting ATPase subunit KdpA, partial [Candidatus Limnocylindrales bacterium]